MGQSGDPLSSVTAGMCLGPVSSASHYANKHVLGDYGVLGTELSASPALSHLTLTDLGSYPSSIYGEKQGTDRVSQLPGGPQGADRGVGNPQCESTVPGLRLSLIHNQGLCTCSGLLLLRGLPVPEMVD